MTAALAPALIVLLFAAWCGTFGNWSGGLAGGATAVAAAGGQLLVLLTGAYGLAARGDRPGRSAAEPRWDPWRLGRAGRFLPLALAAAVALAWSTSPVPRAGRVGLVLLPAFFGVPVAVASGWRDARRRRIGLGAIAVVVAAIALESLAEWAAGGTARAADPLGHHLLLTAWLALLMPLAVLPWREGGAWRAVAGVAGLAGVAALVATRSLAGALALGVEGTVALVALAVMSRRSGRWGRKGGLGRLRLAAIAALVLLASVPLAPLLPRLARVLAGTDSSARARAVYWRAGWEGVADRPVTGLGPGATAWTLAAYLRPIPGVNPPGEVVGELHLLPLEIAYELGLPGLALAAGLVLVFAGRRLRELGGLWQGADPELDPTLVLAGLAGLAGGAAAGLGTGDWRIGALPVAAAVAAGAALAGGRPREEEQGPGPVESRRRRAPGIAMACAYVLAAALLLTPLDRAQREYDLATQAPPGRAVAHLDRAVRLDPDFPLYRARRAWLEAEMESSPGSRPEQGFRAVGDALRAAQDGPGVAVLWLGAGEVARRRAGDPSDSGIAATAFERACALQPLGAFAPFGLLAVAESAGEATGEAALAARALAADPRLAAATLWSAKPGALERGLGVLSETGGIDPGWREVVVGRIRAIRGAQISETPGGPPASDEVGALATVLDAHPEGSVSLHLFRRLPWWGVVMRVAVRSSAARALGALPAATELPGTEPGLFPPTCGGPVGPQSLRKSLWKTR